MEIKRFKKNLTKTLGIIVDNDACWFLVYSFVHVFTTLRLMLHRLRYKHVVTWWTPLPSHPWASQIFSLAWWEVSRHNLPKKVKLAFHIISLLYQTRHQYFFHCLLGHINIVCKFETKQNRWGFLTPSFLEQGAVCIMMLYECNSDTLVNNA